LTARAARHDLALRLVAGVAAAAFLATGYFLIASPAADTLSGSSDRLTASAPNAMALYNLRAAAVMDFAGPPGAGLEVAATTARLAPTTRNALFARRVMIPNVKGASFAWSAAAASGQIVRIRFGNQRQDAIAGLMLEPGPAGDKPLLRIRAIDTNLTAEIMGAPATASFGGVTFADPANPSAPMQIEVPTGETLTLAFDGADAVQRARLIPGETLDRGHTPALSLGRVEVGQPSAANSQPRLTSVAEQACAGKRGRLLLLRPAPLTWDCRLAKDEAHDPLAATGLSLAAGSIGIALTGSAYSSSGGRLRPAGLWSRVAGNPAVAALMVALAGAIAWPLWRLRRGG